MIEIAKQIVEAFEDFGESFKTKEYVCYYRDNEGFIRETYLTKKELYKFINKHQLADMSIYKIKDKIKDKIEIERELRIKEDKQ